MLWSESIFHNPFADLPVAASIGTQVLVKKNLKMSGHSLLGSESLGGVCEQSCCYGCTLRAVSLQYALLHLT